MDTLAKLAFVYLIYRFYCFIKYLHKKSYQNKVKKNAGKKGLTNLMAAAFAGDIQMVSKSIKSGENVNQQDDEGNTALMYACVGTESIIIVKMLLDASAEPQLKNKKGQTAFDMADERKISYFKEMMNGEKIEWHATTQTQLALVDAIAFSLIGLEILYGSTVDKYNYAGMVFALIFFVFAFYQLRLLKKDRYHTLAEFEAYGVKTDCFKESS